MVDFSKPLALADKHNGLINRRYGSIRVLTSDRISPVDFRHVLLVHNAEAMFGSEEFVVTANDEGQISGRGFTHTKLINHEEHENDARLVKILASEINAGRSVWLYGEGEAQLANDALEAAGVNYMVLSAREFEQIHGPSARTRELQRVYEELEDLEVKTLFIDNTGVEQIPYQVDVFLDKLRTERLQIVGAGRNNGHPAFKNRMTHFDLEILRTMDLTNA